MFVIYYFINIYILHFIKDVIYLTTQQVKLVL